MNSVRLNSGLNADLAIALADSTSTEFDIVQPFVADYELNHRQLVVYIIDCEAIDCIAETDRFDKMSKLVEGSPIKFLYSSPANPIDHKNVASDLDETIHKILDRKMDNLFNLNPAVSYAGVALS